jgi:hypothetical protein
MLFGAPSIRLVERPRRENKGAPTMTGSQLVVNGRIRCRALLASVEANPAAMELEEEGV